MGAPLLERQHLAQALQEVLHQLEQTCTLHCPTAPDALGELPSGAQHLLWQPDGAMHTDWRAELHQLNRPYQLVYGTDLEALKRCVYALLPTHLAGDWARQSVLPRWTGACETCGDADCEQRLFSRLLQG
jgi:hypothetical protein